MSPADQLMRAAAGADGQWRGCIKQRRALSSVASCSCCCISLAKRRLYKCVLCSIPGHTAGLHAAHVVRSSYLLPNRGSCRFVCMLSPSLYSGH
jgi:hypothetical protein